MTAELVLMGIVVFAIAAGLVLQELEHRERRRELAQLERETAALQAEIAERRRRLHMALLGSTLEPPRARKEWVN